MVANHPRTSPHIRPALVHCPITPAVRGNVARGVLRESLEGLAPSLARRVRDELGADAVDRIERASMVGWVPLDEHLALLAALRGALGDHEFRARARRGSTRILQDSMFKGLIDVTLRLMGVTPRSLLKVAEKGWASGFRLCGSLLHREISDRSSRLLLLSFPATGPGADAFFLGLEGTLDALVEISGHRGRATMNVAECAPGRTAFDVTWEERKAAAGRG